VQKTILIFACVGILFVSCATTNTGSVPADIINGAATTDTAISGLQQQQTDSATDAQAITDTSTALADSINTAVEQLKAGAITDAEFAAIIQRVQNRQPVNYIEPVGHDNGATAAGTADKKPAE
jgi:hypothetical protein